MITLQASCILEYNFPQSTSAVFMLRPRSGAAQWLIQEHYRITPQPTFGNIDEYTDNYGNLCQRIIFPQGLCRVESNVTVVTAANIDTQPLTMNDTTPDGMADGNMSMLTLPPEVLSYLLPSRYCLPEFLLNDALNLTQNAQTGYAKAAAICNYINQNFVYEYGSSDANSTALDTWINKKGVCRDFAHLGISLCRALNMPARMVVGYLYELDPMDLHAWYEVFIGGRWYTFDATQSEPKGGRIVIGYGRDAADVAFATFFDGFELKNMQVSVTAIK